MSFEWLLISLLGGVGSLLLEVFQRRLRRRRGGETTSERIEHLTRSLRDSVEMINSIEREIKARQQLVGRLRADAEHYKRIVEMNKADVEAVAQLLGGEVRKESRRSFWMGVAVNLLFFLSGAGVTVLVSMIAI